jgi:predicted TIM-barrel fold metal-dependent hydrolase
MSWTPFARLPELLELATLPNVAVKMTGVPMLSQSAYPYLDVRKPIAEIIAKFGPDRVMWGTDWTRTETVSYREGVNWFREWDELSAGEREQILGATAQKLFNFPSPSTGIADSSVRRVPER